MLESQDFQAEQELQGYLAHQDQWDLQEIEASLEKTVQWDPGAHRGHREAQAPRESQDQVGSQENLEIMADQVHLG